MRAQRNAFLRAPPLQIALVYGGLSGALEDKTGTPRHPSSPLLVLRAACGPCPTRPVLSQITENRKVEARKSLILQHTIFTFGRKKATLRQNPFKTLERLPKLATS